MDTTNGITSPEGRVLSVQLAAVRDDVKDIKTALSTVLTSMDNLVRMEEKQLDFRSALSRAFEEIKVERDKLAIITGEMPSYRALRRWVIGGVVAGLGMMGVALFNLLVIQPLYRGYGVGSPPIIITPPSVVKPNGTT